MKLHQLHKTIAAAHQVLGQFLGQIRFARARWAVHNGLLLAFNRPDPADQFGFVETGVLSKLVKGIGW